MEKFRKLLRRKRKGQKAPLPPQTPELKDEHGCIIGRQLWDEKSRKCVPIPHNQPFVPLGGGVVRRRRMRR